ncbi:MAG TPA: ABC transporter permease, partial [Methylomirabilota bacterium]
MTLRRLAHRLLALVRASRLDRELDDEIRAHLELAERDAMAAGLSADEAQRAARLRFGGIEPTKETHRDQRSVRWLENLVKDFRYGLASLARDPGFTGIAVGVLALGIGANAAMFSLVDAVLLKPIPFPHPERIVRIWEAPRPGATNATSTLDFLDWKRLGTSFEALSAEHPLRAALTGNGEPVRLPGRAVTSDYFRVFGAGALLGRTFTPDDDRPGAAPVVVISHAAWQSHFGGDAGILGRRLVLDGVGHDVVGVLPPGVFDRDEARFWKPLVFTPDQQRRDWHWLSVAGRLREGVTLEEARAEMQAIDAALTDVMPIWKRDWTLVVERFDALLVGDTLRRSVVVALGAVAVVLLIACANVANLLLARGVARKKEMAIRAALGASRGRLVAQLFTEGLVLCVLGGFAGLATASILIAAATPVLAETVPYGAPVVLDLRVLAFTAAVALGVALLIGALPSLQLSIGSPSATLSHSTRGASRAQGRFRRAIVIGEVALSLVLVCGAVLLFRSLLNLRQIDSGVRIDHVITMAIDLPEHAYPTPERTAGFYEALIAEVEGAPGVARAGLATHLPLQWIGNGEGLFVPGVDEPVNVRFKRVDPGYFDALEIPVLAGRGITARDRAGTPPVVVANEALMRLLIDRHMADPVGQTVQLTTADGNLPVEIAGVIRS